MLVLKTQILYCISQALRDANDGVNLDLIGIYTVQSWLQGTWFPEERRWAKAYREHKLDLKINTNNGVEAQDLLSTACKEYIHLQFFHRKTLKILEA